MLATLASFLAWPAAGRGGTPPAPDAEADPAMPPAGCAIPAETLEANGAVIRKIYIENLNIFDLDDPKEDKALFRAMNNLHIRTRPSVVSRQLLFEEGAPYQQRALEESARNLRNAPYLYDAEIEVVACDPENVDVRVRTRDVWTLQPGIAISRSGGETRYGFDLFDENFLGSGASIRYSQRNDEERRSREIGYSNQNVRLTRLAVDATIAENSDGHVVDLGLVRPFYSLDTRWTAGGRITDLRQREKVYSLGDEIGRYREDLDYLELFGGRSRGLVDGWVQRSVIGLTYDKRRFANFQDSLDPELVPEDREFLYPFIEYQLIEDRFIRAENLDQIYRTEDLFIGAEVRFRLGLMADSFGSDRNAALFSATASRAYGDPAESIWAVSTYASGRIESYEFRNALVGGTLTWYRRETPRRLSFMGLKADVGESLDLDNPIEVGGDMGLRGYPLRYQRGHGRALFTLEQRYFTDYYLWRLLRVGGAVFYDMGRVWGRNPYGGENLGLLRDVGFGLRLASTRSSVGRMIHIDLAFPLDGDDSIDSVQFLIEVKRSF
jgi:hypothetical protein